MKHILFACLLFIGFAASAQKPPLLIDPVEIEEKVHAELDALMSSESYQKFKSKWPDAKGELVFDVSVAEKGMVQTVFQASSTIEDVKFRNAFKDFLRTYRFGFKMKKGTNHKVRHTFNIQ